MQHVPIDSCDNDRETGPNEDDDEDDDDLSNRTLITENEDELTRLPSDGYRIFDQRSSFPHTLPRIPTGENTFARPEDPGTSRFKRRLLFAIKYSIKNWSNILLVFVPLGILAPRLGFSDYGVFVLNCIAIIPLADVLCRATDAVSSYLGETGGALLNVTMGNATEVMIFVHALLQRQYMIVRTSLLGSIIVNILLVLGLAIATGEFHQRGQTYSRLATRVAAALLCLTTVALLVPSNLRTSNDPIELAQDVLTLSRGISIVLIVVYLLYLWTQMRSSRFGYTPLIQHDPNDTPEVVEITDLSRSSYRRRTLSYPREPLTPLIYEELSFHDPAQKPGFGASAIGKISSAYEGAKSVPWVRKCSPVVALMVSTALISVCGSFLVDSIDHFVDHSPISKMMVGLIILPIVGNAAEIVSAIMFASRKQMDLAFAVSIGSAIQIALFVTPLMVVAGWILDRDMALHFTVFEAETLVASTVLFCCLCLDNRCSLLKGVSLFAGYTIIALASYFVPNSE